ncbi:alpha/beta hydrolase family protein [Humibacillus xanthopallidus]|uniref:Alpha/beta hydrolase family protein n=1 Tax=Humibacillus xanthopallidus TaxID=412689 RepID=A0A543PMM8_9MICO|nr:alpha/beta hydrolase [Humibacillus xanthopallidus]TQN45329.1 alpha/beta hydrolase family protein [Humibacillus xanthopallidus]
MTTPLAAIARALTATTAVLGLLLTAGCSSSEPPVPTAGATGVPPATAAPSAGLDGYYSQKLTWSPCNEADECADLRVPLDYDKPDPSTDLTLKVLRVPAKDQQGRIGSLVVNPGGPGASAMDYASAADAIVGTQVRRYYDVVGFDPRGVGRSAPLECLSDRQLDAYMGADQTPDNPAEEKELLAQAQTLADGCEAKNPTLLPHLSTADSAKDMDVLRAALGDSQLNYLGKSYGTFLGSTYAGLFPKRVGRFVLDGVVPPDLTNAELSEGQARGFELATRTYVADCVSQGDCPLGSSVDEGMAWIRSFLAEVDRNPIPTGDPNVPQMNESWASWGLGQAMYDQSSWGALTDALREAKAGNGAGLMAFANAYAGRERNGTYSSNIMQVLPAVNCLDRPDSPDLSTYETYAKEFTKVAPTWGATLAWGGLACGIWPAKEGSGPHTISAEGSGPIVVVGTTRDPATIYEWSKRLKDQLSNAVLLSYDGDGHTAYRRSNDCVDSAIDAYYVQGRVPKDGLTC